jgi:hypothetical protein
LIIYVKVLTLKKWKKKIYKNYTKKELGYMKVLLFKTLSFQVFFSFFKKKESMGSDDEDESDKSDEDDSEKDSEESEEETEESEEEEGKGKIKLSELIGCNTNGTKFDDNPKYKLKITGITVWGTSYLDAIQLHFGKKKGQTHGTTSGSPSDFILKKGEKFVKAEITYNTSDIYSLSLTTNKGKEFIYLSKGNTKKWGGNGTTTKSVSFKKGLLNITGEISTYPRKLQFHFKK